MLQASRPAEKTMLLALYFSLAGGPEDVLFKFFCNDYCLQAETQDLTVTSTEAYI